MPDLPAISGEGGNLHVISISLSYDYSEPTAENKTEISLYIKTDSIYMCVPGRTVNDLSEQVILKIIIKEDISSKLITFSSSEQLFCSSEAICLSSGRDGSF